MPNPLGVRGTTYYFFLADSERSIRYSSEEEARIHGMDWVKMRMQAHIPHVTLRKAVAGVRGSEIVDHFYAFIADPPPKHH